MIGKFISWRSLRTIGRSLFSFATSEQQPNLTRLQRYAAIKEKNMRAKQANKEKREQQRLEKIKEQGQKLERNIPCEGCSVHLQSERMDKYGYIDSKVLMDSITHNQNIISEQSQRTDDTIKIIRQVEQELGVQVLRKEGGPLQNLDNLEVLMRIEQKQEQSRKQRQSVVPQKYSRKQLLCKRCFYLKHHNRLPDEYNKVDMIIDETDEKQLLERIFNRKGDTYYLYLVDVFDVCGSLTEVVLERLFVSRMQFSILLTKFDMVNRKYFNYIAMKPIIRSYIQKVLEQMKDRGVVQGNYKLDDYLQHIYFISSNNGVGLNKLKKQFEQTQGKVQMIGYPNTGKTSLLNKITSQKKPTSTVPGTSLSFEIGRFNKVKIFDCPGLYNRKSLVNLIKAPNLKSLLTWKQPHFAPGILTNSVIFYGGMIEAEGVRVILFGNGGAKAINKHEVSRWLIDNYEQFWKGLPNLAQLQIVRHELSVEFEDMVGPDIEIAGYGFIGLRLCRVGKSSQGRVTKKIYLYLPSSVQYRLRKSLILDNGLHDKSALRKVFGLSRLRHQS